MYPERPVVREEPAYVERAAGPAYVERGGSGLAGYAVAKYAFLFAIVVVVLFFVAKYLLPLFTNR